MKNFPFILLALAILFPGYLSAQTTQAEIESFLVKEWIHSPVSASVDQYASGKCESGKYYTFLPEGNLEIRECRNNRMRTTQQTWALKQSEYGDWQLHWGTAIYNLEMAATPGKETLVLIPELPEAGEGGEENTVELPPISLYRLAPLPETESPD